MTWTQLDPFSTGDLLTAQHMNDIVGNLEFLAAGNYFVKLPALAGNYTTTSTTFVDVDATEWSQAITTSVLATGVRVTAQMNAYVSANANVIFFDIARDGTRLGNSSGLARNGPTVASALPPWHVAALDTGITPGSEHTYTLQWRVNGSTGNLQGGAADRPLFTVEEVR